MDGVQCTNEARFWITCRKHTPPSLLPPGLGGGGGGGGNDPVDPPDGGGGAGKPWNWAAIGTAVSAIAKAADEVWKVVSPHIHHIKHFLYDPGRIEALAERVREGTSGVDQNWTEIEILDLQQASTRLIAICEEVITQMALDPPMTEAESEPVDTTKVIAVSEAEYIEAFGTSVMGPDPDVGKYAEDRTAEQSQPVQQSRSAGY